MGSEAQKRQLLLGTAVPSKGWGSRIEEENTTLSSFLGSLSPQRKNSEAKEF